METEWGTERPGEKVRERGERGETERKWGDKDKGGWRQNGRQSD